MKGKMRGEEGGAEEKEGMNQNREDKCDKQFHLSTSSFWLVIVFKRNPSAIWLANRNAFKAELGCIYSTCT